jgi:predicted metal-binding protein
MDVNVIVCTDPSRCLKRYSHGRNGDQLLEELQQLVSQHRLQDQVQVTPCRCIFGCTYGPRIDVARRWSGEKVLYGTAQGQASISRRGTVRFSEIPEDLLDLIKQNLPR